MKREVLKITGMECAACARNIERATRRLEGVIVSNVNIVTEKLNIEYEEKVIGIDEIARKIKQLGFSVASNKGEEDSTDILRKRLIFLTVFTIPLFLISMLPMLFHMLNIHVNIFSLRTSATVQFILATCIVVVSYKIYLRGFVNIVKLSPNMDSLIAVGTAAAYIYGIYNTYKIVFWGSNAELYFESVGVIITLITLGKFLEIRVKGKTGEAISKLIALAPHETIVLRDNKELLIKIEDIKKDDIVIVKPGDKIAVDGEVIEGSTYIDESVITGESVPVKKELEDKVISGTLNKSGYIKYKATKVGKDTTLSQIISIVESAIVSKAPIERLADIVASYFVPTVILISFISACIWLFNGYDIEFVLKIFVSVLVIACPCALGLATPTAIIAGTGRASENGVLIKSAEILETLYKTDTVVFDKTGTLTEGNPKVSEIDTLDISEEELIKIAASVEKFSEHPLAESIVNLAADRKIELYGVTDFKNVPGMGVSACIGEQYIFIGSLKFMKESRVNIDNSKIKFSDEKSYVYVAVNNKLKGALTIYDIPRKSSKDAIEKLNLKHVETIMLTGDNRKVAQGIAEQLKIKTVISEVMPEDKANEIAKLKKAGKKVAMVGDGINDSPALVTADVGIAVSNGTDIAIDSADVILMKNDLNDIAFAINVSRKTVLIIKENLFWAFLYNLLGIPVAAGILYVFGGPLLSPMIAAFCMAFSSLSVLTNALRLRKIKI